MAPQRITLSCTPLRLEVQFTLRAGEYARLGAGEEMEITLPIQGMREEECRFELRGDGELIQICAAGKAPATERAPISLIIAGYPFSLTREPLLACRAPSPSDAEKDLPFRVDTTGPGLNRVLLLVAAGIAAVIGTIVVFSIKSYDSSPSSDGPLADSHIEERRPDESAEEPQAAPSKPSLDLETLASTIAPAVFTLEIDRQDAEQNSHGTGFAVTPDGLIVTNFHVIQDAAGIVAKTAQGGAFKISGLVAKDEEADLAIIRAEGTNLACLTLGSSEAIPPGRRIITFGSPHGLAGSISEGIVSAKRSEPGDGLPNQGVLIQMTAAISPGSSGSPLLDTEGRVIGIVTLGSSGSLQNLNFAVPVEVLIPLLERARTTTDLLPLGSHSEALEPASPQDAYSKDPVRGQLEETKNDSDWIAAMDLARKLRENYPQVADAHAEFGNCAAALQFDDEAATAYRQSLILDPNQTDVWTDLGLLLQRRRNLVDALAAFEKAVLVQSRNSSAWSNLARCAALQKQWRRATAAMHALEGLDHDEAVRVASLLLRHKVHDEELRKLAETVVGNEGHDGAAAVQPEFQVQGVANDDFLTLRSGPGSNFEPIIKIRNGTRGIFAAGPSKLNGNTLWVPVNYSGKHGWVSAKYLMLVEK